MGTSAFFSRHQPGGMFAIEDNSRSTGDRFFVDSGSSTNSDSSGAGQNPDRPFATLDFAVGQCTANNGDIIYLMPGDSQTVSTAGSLDFDVVGITIVGIGNGSDQPTITLDTANTADIDIDAANITIENVHFIANFLDIVEAIDVNADDFTLRNCRFTDNSTTLNAKIWIRDTAAGGSDRITLEGCRCDAFGDANSRFIIFTGTGSGHIVRDNILFGDWGTACIGGAGVVTLCAVLNNYIFNKATSADLCISMAATATGILADNRCTAGHASQGIIPGNLGSMENYYEQNTSDLSGVIEPATA